MMNWNYYREQFQYHAKPPHLLFGLRNIPVDVLTLCFKLGISVTTKDSQILQSEVYVPDNNILDRPTIKVKHTVGDEFHRTRVAIAHSLGHIMLHKPKVYSHSVVSYSSRLSQEDDEAGKFALELLMPEEFVFVEGMRLNGNIEKLSRVFGVPESWMRQRMCQVFPI